MLDSEILFRESDEKLVIKKRGRRYGGL